MTSGELCKRLRDYATEVAKFVGGGDRDTDVLTMRQAADRIDADAKRIKELEDTLRLIAEGYFYDCKDERYLLITNPAFAPDNGSDPYFVVDTARAALKETPAGGISEAERMRDALEEIASGLSVRLPYDIANEALGRTPAEEHHG